MSRRSNRKPAANSPTPAPQIKPVLLIERDSFTRVIFAQYLRSKGYKVVPAGDVTQAIDAARKHRYKTWHALIAEQGQSIEHVGDQSELRFGRRILLSTPGAPPHRASRGVRREKKSAPVESVHLLTKPVPPKTLIHALAAKR